MMTIMMMQRIIESVHKNQEILPTNNQILTEKLDYEKRSTPIESETQMFITQKRISDDSRDVEMCDNKSDTEEEDLNIEVDVENDETLCPVDLTRRQEKYTTFENLLQSKTDESDYNKTYKTLKEDDLKSLSCKRSESVCSDVSRSESPRERSPSVGTHQNRRLAFSVENILDPNKFTGRQAVFSDSICCWKPNQDSIGSPEFDGSETGWLIFFVCFRQAKCQIYTLKRVTLHLFFRVITIVLFIVFSQYFIILKLS